jgi:amino acid adenylation domain-containing protein
VDALQINDRTGAGILDLGLRGTLQVESLGAALGECARRDDAGSAVRAFGAPALALRDLSGLRPSDADAQLAAAAESLAVSAVPQALLIMLPGSAHRLLLPICAPLDRVSLGLRLEELLLLYAAASQSRPLDSVVRCVAPESSRALAEHSDWWRDAFANGPVHPCDLPLDRASSGAAAPAAAAAGPGAAATVGPHRIAQLRVPAELAAQLAGGGPGAARTAGETALVAAFVVLLGRLNSSSAVALSLLNPRVAHAGVLAPLQLDLPPASGIDDALAQVAAAVDIGLAHASLDLAGLFIAAGDRAADLAAATRVVLDVLGPWSEYLGSFDGMEASCEAPGGIDPRSHDLVVSSVRTRAGLELRARYRADLLRESTVAAWLDAALTLLRGLLASRRAATVGSLAMAGTTALAQLRRMQPAPTPYPRDGLVQELFEAQADATPDRVATGDARSTWTYHELEARANRYAHALRARGVQRGQFVGISLDRGVEMLAALLGALKAGAGYVPLDPAFPAERLAFMASDAQLAVVITQAEHAARFSLPAERLLRVDVDQGEIDAAPAARLPRDARSATAMDDAFVVYTSGSTGKPKGVRVHHRSAVNFLVSIRTEPGISPDEVVVAVTTLSFDMHLYELLLPVTVGARTLIASRDQARDGRALRQLLEQSGATFLQTTPATWRMLVESGWAGHRGFTMVSAGEPLPTDLATEMLRRAGAVWNGYGPSETGYATFWRVEHPERGMLIGHPIANSTVWVLDEQRNVCPVGIRGELYIGGDCVALGYLGRAELTAERFVPDPFSVEPGARLYRTGDRGRWCDNGELETSGRLDHQVKIRGYRIELGEIEAQLASHPGIAQAVAVVREDVPGDPRLVAYVVYRDAPVAEAELRTRLAERLPDYMVPTHVVPLDAIPLLPNKKTDRLALPAPGRHRPELAQAYVGPANDAEAQVCRVFAETLGLERVGRLDNFFELGGSSLLVMRALPRLQAAGLPKLSATAFFREPTPAAIVASQQDSATAAAGRPLRARAAAGEAEPVALVAAAGRFPGAADVEAFWRNLLEGRESIREFTDAELDPSIPRSLREDPAYVRARGIIDDLELFDAGFFGIGTREAELMDPQQRIFLELCWEALERAGHVPESFDGDIGVFAGQYHSGYLQKNLLPQPGLVEKYGELNVSLLNEKDYLATRAAFKLGLTGPAISLYTACSTSLVAIAQAFDSLRNGQCDMAIAGGVSITYPHRSGYLYQEGAMLSPDGRTRSFSEEAQGTVFSDGAAIVVLKRLSDALADGNPVLAVLRGASVNNDGSKKASFTAPSATGQAAVIAAALEVAGVGPETIGYVETHGTATPIGDPIEIDGLTSAFRRGTDLNGYCAIGSVKSNVGHLIIAAGATGVIKTALALAEERLPASLHAARPSSRIEFANTPFYLQAATRDWKRGEVPRRAGVSSFGVGGTNAHVVLEEAPLLAPRSIGAGSELLMVSARSAAALDAALERLGRHLAESPGLALADVAHTLRVGRRPFPHRAFIVAQDAAGAARQLLEPDARLMKRELASGAPQVVYMFPGQGSQYPGMGRALHVADETFRAAFDECADALLGEGVDLRRILLAAEEGADADLAATAITQPATFAVEYALARMWMAYGVQPAALIGHSVGEFVCAALAGVMTVADAARLVARRGRLMQALPPGSMLTVRMTAADLEARLPAGLSIAAYNGPMSCVLSGETRIVEAFRARLEADGIGARLLHTSHAFHSAMMDPAVPEFAREVAATRLQAPQIPIMSTLSGDWLEASQATDPAYWARHLRAPVAFSQGIRRLAENPGRVFLEVGPRATLSTLARQHLGTRRAAPFAVASLGDSAEGERARVLGAIGALWASGVEVDLSTLSHPAARRVRLPTYPFQRLRYWIAAPAANAAPAMISPADAAPTQDAAAAPQSSPETTMQTTTQPASTPSRVAADRRPRLMAKLKDVIEDVSGIETGDASAGASFVELGLDSLSLTQIALQLQKSFGVKVTFRQLMEDFVSLEMLVGYLDGAMPADPLPEAAAPPVAAVGSAAPAIAAAPPAAMPMSAPVSAPVYAPAPPLAASFAMTAAPGSVQQVIQMQMELMRQQLALLSGQPAAAFAPQPVGVAPSPAVAAAPPAAPSQAAPPASASAPGASPAAVPASASGAPAAAVPAVRDEAPSGPVKYDVKTAFGAIARIHTSQSLELDPRQRARLDAFIKRYVARTPKSKAYTTEHRPHLADPRVVNGFRPLVKEIIYQVVVDRSRGSHLWDIDGNEYVDALNGFGTSLFGWQPEFVMKAVREQVERGYEIGPMHPLAGEVARLTAELTGFDRAALCNTGSEAVMGAMRIARTVTGRSKIAIFSGSYHGIFDEVIVRGTKKLRAVPAAPGILPNAAENVLVVDYGTDESLEIIRAQADDLAAVMVEPVQSRRPDFQPREFLHKLRDITQKSGSVYIFDEVITGFRAHIGGAQAHFGVRADLGTYGKVVGGGFPIGAIAGKREFMDALDGGHWNFGDDSIPTVGVTYFAGTFVRHPLTLAAAHASLLHMKEQGPDLQRRLNERVTAYAQELNAFLREVGAPIEIRHFASLWRTTFLEDHPLQDLLFAMMRSRGVHILDNFPCFFTTAHSEADFQFITKAYKESVLEMQQAEFLPGKPVVQATVFDASRPPAPGARLGRDRDGSPAWFVPDPNEQGKYRRYGG